MHHYGRHGPRAWLKWRKRHAPRPSSLPVPVKQPIIFHIQIPQEAERVFIVVDQPNENQEVTIVSNFPTVQHLPEPEEDQRVIEEAIREADRITRQLPEQACFIISKAELVRYRIGPEADACVRALRYQMDSAKDKEEYLIQLFIDTCFNHIPLDRRRTLEDEKDRELLELAQRDCKNPPIDREDGKVSYHKEHGYVIRALEVLEIVQRGTYERLEEAHDRADKYRSFYRQGEGMVVWPDESTFRRW